MSKIKDKMVGKATEIAAEVTGDAKLAEGKEQVKKGKSQPALEPDNEPAIKPVGNLDKLT
jgi:uncharacterized protein YjbJ (UPF0337 family)